jgi:small subunit ribosomal protein S1
VDIGGVDGLLHISDMSHARVEKPEDILSEGDQLKVKVLKIDREEKKIGLGLKQTMPDPWSNAAQKWPEGEIVTGRVTKLMDFGAFVELEQGVEGLIPGSELSWERRMQKPSEIVSVDEVVRVRVIRVEPGRKRITLSLKQAGDDPWLGASARWPEGAVVTGVVTRTADFGAFVQLAEGVEGLVHISELSFEHVPSVTSVVNVGDTVQAKVISVDEERRRIGLSIKQKDAPAEWDGGDYSTGGDEHEAEVSEKRRKKRKRPLKGGLD